MRDLASTFAAAGGPVLLQLARYLLDDEQCAPEGTDHFGVASSGVSRHLGKLIDASPVERRPVGRPNYHRVINPGTVLLRAAEQHHKR